MICSVIRKVGNHCGAAIGKVTAYLKKTGLLQYVAVIAFFSCAVPGRVLHIENRATVPYTAENERLKARMTRVLIKHRYITEEDREKCVMNIMEIDRYYFIEVWPAGIQSSGMFGIKLKKPFLSPAGTFTRCDQ